MIGSALELTAGFFYTHKTKPDMPTHWNDHANREALLKSWDAVRNIASFAKHEKSMTAQLVSVVRLETLETFHELGEGEVLLTRGWIENVLGTCVRQPFCTSEKISRWQVLGSSAGMRGNWGPFQPFRSGPQIFVGATSEVILARGCVTHECNNCSRGIQKGVLQFEPMVH